MFGFSNVRPSNANFSADEANKLETVVKSVSGERGMGSGEALIIATLGKRIMNGTVVNFRSILFTMLFKESTEIRHQVVQGETGNEIRACKTSAVTASSCLHLQVCVCMSVCVHACVCGHKCVCVSVCVHVCLTAV